MAAPRAPHACDPEVRWGELRRRPGERARVGGRPVIERRAAAQSAAGARRTTVITKATPSRDKLALMAAPAFDSRQFRTALGAFTTGVTIVTTRGIDGAAIGLTANSFNSLSLDPPMVMWALARLAKSLQAFQSAGYFAVHVVAADQQALSDLFARRGADKFSQLEYDEGPERIPLLRGCAARFQCRTAYRYDGGDHLIIVGEVLQFDDFRRPALAFHGGSYAHVVRPPRTAQPDGHEQDPSSDSRFSRDFLGYLLGSVHARLMSRVGQELRRYGLHEEHYYVLMFLSDAEALTLADLAALTQLSDRSVSYQTVADLAIRDLVLVCGPDDPSTRVSLTPHGHQAIVEIGAALKAAESDVERCLGASEVKTLKLLLRGLLHGTARVSSSIGAEEDS